MIKNYFNDDKLFESVYKMNECGGTPGGGCGANKLTCGGGGGCGFRESKLRECGSSCDTRSTYGCGSLGYSHSCEVGRTVKISVGEGCGSHIAVGRLLGYAS